jgi:alkylation response protein AidB-like acyl-CoA dehydrogenase
MRAALTAGPAFVDLLAGAQALGPLIEAQADAAEAKRALTDDVIDAIHAAGIVGMWTPRSLGGSEVRPIEGLQLIEQLSYSHGSTGWVLMAMATPTAVAGAFLGDAAVAELFADGIPRISGQGVPIGKAELNGDGYTLSGQWSYGSGVPNGTHVHTGAMVFAEGKPKLTESGGREARIFVVPRTDVTLADNWHVIGLKATGSIDYSVDELYVPAEYTHTLDADTPLRGGTLYYLGILGMGAISHTAFALGVGRRILDELGALARGESGRFASIAESDSFTEQFGAAEGKLRAARAFAYETINDVQETLEAGDRLSVRQHSLLRLIVNTVTWSVADVCAFAYAESGGVGLRSGTIQRCFCDINAGTQHVIVGRGPLGAVGQELLGLYPDKVWAGRTLVDPA